MIYSLVPSDDPLLHKRVEKCSYNLNRVKLSDDLHENMLHHDGVGLSANQIGIEERAFIMVIDVETQRTITCFNPKILKISNKLVKMEEGCLSFPKKFIDVDRPSHVVMKYEDEWRNTHKLRLEGFIARIFLHEYDHMEGIVFTSL
tara:strand:+ start:39 stop:476 length:438 start_codon:yes stop_codon:yes gene_type:complete